MTQSIRLYQLLDSFHCDLGLVYCRSNIAKLLVSNQTDFGLVLKTASDMHNVELAEVALTYVSLGSFPENGFWEIVKSVQMEWQLPLIKALFDHSKSHVGQNLGLRMRKEAGAISTAFVNYLHHTYVVALIYRKRS